MIYAVLYTCASQSQALLLSTYSYTLLVLFRIGHGFQDGYDTSLHKLHFHVRVCSSYIHTFLFRYFYVCACSFLQCLNSRARYCGNGKY